MFTEVIRAWLEANERNQSYLARKADLDESYLSMLLNGQRHPGPRALRKLERAMGMKPGSLSANEAKEPADV